MEHPKILFIHHGKGIGGAPLSLLYLVQKIAKTRYRPMVAFLHHSEAIDLFKQQGITTQEAPIGRYDFPHTKIWWFKWYHPHYLLRAIVDSLITLFITAPALYKKERPAIIHLNTSSLIAWGLAAKWRNIPVIWHIREPLAEGYFGLRKKFITYCVAYAASKIVAISHNDSLPWANNPKAVVIHNAVPSERFDCTITPISFIAQHHLTASPRILFVGGCSAEKGTLTILKAFNLLLAKTPSAQLLVAGYMPQKTQPSPLQMIKPDLQYAYEVQKYIEKNHANIVLFGAIQQIPEAMAASDVVVFPATVGHFARPIIEAGFMKKPVLASALAPMDELVIDKSTGFLLDPYDYQAWADRLELLLNHPTTARDMGEQGFAYCTKAFSLPQQITKIVQLYDDVTKRSTV